MDEIQRKEVRVSEQFDVDVISLYTFGEEMFGSIAAKSLISDIYGRIWSLDQLYLLFPECKYLLTRDKRYRNIIIGSYLIIYRITPNNVDVLRILHSHSSISKIKTSRQVKLR